MPTTSVAQWTCAVSNLGFIYIYRGVNIDCWTQGGPLKYIGVHMREQTNM